MESSSLCLVLKLPTNGTLNFFIIKAQTKTQDFFDPSDKHLYT